MSGAIGEGMSDTLGILINDDDVVGEYSASDPIGIRSAPYTAYPRTYGDFSGASVHFDGEIYAATIWRLWQLFQAGAIPKETLFDYLIGGMNFTPAGPAFEDMRDGILQTASATGHECLIWQAFADFAVGEGAQGNSNSVTESFTLPASCAWSGGFAGNASCDTDGAGQCEVTSGPIPNRNKTVTLTVTGIPGADYDQAENHDADGDSDGTAITVNKLTSVIG